MKYKNCIPIHFPRRETRNLHYLFLRSLPLNGELCAAWHSLRALQGNWSRGWGRAEQTWMFLWHGRFLSEGGRLLQRCLGFFFSSALQEKGKGKKSKSIMCVFAWSFPLHLSWVLGWFVGFWGSFFISTSVPLFSSCLKRGLNNCSVPQNLISLLFLPLLPPAFPLPGSVAEGSNTCIECKQEPGLAWLLPAGEGWLHQHKHEPQ